MTKPSGGYPDYQSYASWKGTATTNMATAYPVGDNVIGDFLLTNYASLNVVFIATVGNGDVKINFYTDATKTTLLGAYLIPLTTTAPIALLVPAISNFAEIVLSVNSVGGMTVNANIEPSNISDTYVVFSGIEQHIFRYNVSLAASATDSFNLPAVVPGSAYLSFVPGDATGKLQVSVIATDKAGNNVALLSFDQAPTVPVSRTIMLPAFPCKLVITNNDAAGAHSYYAALVAPGRS